MCLVSCGTCHLKRAVEHWTPRWYRDTISSHLTMQRFPDSPDSPPTQILVGVVVLYSQPGEEGHWNWRVAWFFTMMMMMMMMILRMSAMFIHTPFLSRLLPLHISHQNMFWCFMLRCLMSLSDDTWWFGELGQFDVQANQNHLLVSLWQPSRVAHSLSSKGRFLEFKPDTWQGRTN